MNAVGGGALVRSRVFHVEDVFDAGALKLRLQLPGKLKLLVQKHLVVVDLPLRGGYAAGVARLLADGGVAREKLALDLFQRGFFKLGLALGRSLKHSLTRSLTRSLCPFLAVLGSRQGCARGVVAWGRARFPVIASGRGLGEMAGVVGEFRGAGFLFEIDNIGCLVVVGLEQGLDLYDGHAEILLKQIFIGALSLGASSFLLRAGRVILLMGCG